MQNIAVAELSFPRENVVKDISLPKREIHIPVVFQSHAHYKQVFTAALTEHLNILLFDLSQSLHRALSKVDISSYTSVKPGREDKQGSFVPFCQHQQPSKLVMVKKEEDLWVVSNTLLFDPLDTFIDCSALFGPSSNNELEIMPLKGYCPSNWPSDMVVHALHVFNASTELTALRNLQEHFNPASLPLIHRLLKMPDANSADQLCRQRRGFVPPAITPRPAESSGLLSSGRAPDLAAEMIDSYHLNTDQAAVLSQIAKMMEGNNNPDNCSGQDLLPITIVHGSDSEQLRELQTLLRGDLSSIEKAYVSTEQHKLGRNKGLLKEIQSNGSFYNIEEAVFTLKLIQSLIASGIEGSMIGVITLYKSQMDKLSNLLHSDTYCDRSEVKHVQVSTVDAFQGAENEIIVLSCVRTKQVGFIDSEKRMNVALTRGKRHL
ncbi:UNVERIFIED_CONTAM: hypothetical protein FKN15_060731 [Acipenser sinensis]